VSPAKIALVEVFASPQGEGYNAGRWAVFVRLAGCPLACEFAPGVVCDTPYQKANLKVTLDELFEDVIPIAFGRMLDAETRSAMTRVQDLPMLIFTGGEPLASPHFNELMRRAHDTGQFYVAVETNGTRWQQGIISTDWVTVSPKEDVPQTSQARWHNHNPQSTKLSGRIKSQLAARFFQGEYRYVIAANTPTPPYNPATRHYVSPAVLSDGSGEEWKSGFPGFAPGAVESCLRIVRADPRWQISVQTHKFLGVR